MKIYLSGGIYKDNAVATDYWREEVSVYLQKHGFIVINPCRNKLVYDSDVYTPKEITARDHMDINNADIILINGNPYGDHLGIGTWCELERGHALGKPIIVFSTDERVTEHPWVRDYAARIFNRQEDALIYIKEFWGEN